MQPIPFGPENLAFFAGIAFSAAGLGNLLMARQWGKIADRYGYVKILVILLFMAGIFYFPGGFVTNLWQLVLVRFALGVTIGGIIPVRIAYIRQEAPIAMQENPYKELFDPARFQADPSLKKVISINTDVAKHLIKGKLETVSKKPSELENDEGSAVMINGKRAGAYKDTEGKLHLIDTTCTHMGCETEWNAAESSFLNNRYLHFKTCSVIFQTDNLQRTANFNSSFIHILHSI